MGKYNKIHWKKGLEVTPEILTETDNYHISERNLLGHFWTSRLWGLSPDGKFHIEKDIDNDRLSIKKLECLAITRNGYLINIPPNTGFSKELSLNNAEDTELHVVLTVDPYATASEYNLELKKTGETTGDGIPVLKIYQNRHYWEIDADYIPPAVALSSFDALKQQYAEIKDTLNRIVAKLPEENAFYAQATLLKLELDNYSLLESPQELTLLLKKICWCLKLYLKSIKKVKQLSGVKAFIEEQYNHNEIREILHLGIQNLIDIDQRIDEPEVDEYELKI